MSPKNERETPNDHPFSLPPPTGRMRAFTIFVFFLLGIAIGALAFWNPFGLPFLPGGTGEQAPEKASAPEEETAQMWTCPMHPQVMEKEPGNCPICNMKLVPVTTSGAAPAPATPTKTEKKATKQGRRILYYQAPMDPTYISDRPGKSPMGMDLVPVYADEGTEAAAEVGVVKINPAIVQQIGVRTEAVRVGELRGEVRTVGILDYNEKNIFWVNTKFEGWIDKVYVNYIGQRVRKGQKLFEIYSPELVTTQEEYLTALRYLNKLKAVGSPEAVRQAEALVQASRKRLAYWDITEAQIRALERTGRAVKSLTVVSPVSGEVVEKMDAALEGMYVKAGMNLYKIADLSTVWVHADVYESQMPWVRAGLEAEITLPYLPGERFAGKILYLYPFVSEKTRTMRACIEVSNPERRLEPGMYADVRIKPVLSRRAVLVPEDAVIRTGRRDVVFLAMGGGRFMAREVKLGAKGEGGVYEVKAGLKGGEEVVVSAQFLLDSESRLQDFIRKLMAAPKDKRS